MFNLRKNKVLRKRERDFEIKLKTLNEMKVLKTCKVFVGQYGAYYKIRNFDCDFTETEDEVNNFRRIEIMNMMNLEEVEVVEECE